MSGKLSCCTRGGSWFQKCGNLGDPNFDHTWNEGVQACRTKPNVDATTPNNAAMTCRKCVANKAGILSCCTRGGSWFQQCGNSGDSRFDHTWIEGIRICLDIASDKLQEQAALVNGTSYAPEDDSSVTDATDEAFGIRDGNSEGSHARSISFVLMVLLMYI